MKPVAAFAVGLWTGAIVAAAVAVFHFQAWVRVTREISPEMAAGLEAKSEVIRLLRQDQARLAAEAQRLRETVAELKNQMEEQAAEEVAAPAAPARTAEPVASPAMVDAWLEEAVAGSQVMYLPRMEVLALQNHDVALEALALLSSLDNGETLNRVWASDRLDLPRRMRAARFLGATLELNPYAAGLLEQLFASPTADQRVLYAALEGIRNPSFPISFGRRQPVEPPPRFQPDYSLRARLVDTLRIELRGELREAMDRAHEELLDRWAQATP
jgi:hypothetical protein